MFPLNFPPDFLWGTATSAYQVEGGIQNDWSEAGIDAGQACNHVQRYAEDIEQAAALGTNAFRLSLEWAKLEPEPGVWDSAAEAHYHEVFNQLEASGLTPMVTLFHFTLPLWLARRGGWLNPEILPAFERFAGRIATCFGKYVKYWVSVNEPVVYAFKSYEEGSWPPFQTERRKALQVFLHLLQGHVLAVKQIRRQSPTAQIGIAKNLTLLEPYRPWHPADQAQSRFQNKIFNQAFIEALITGVLKLWVPGAGKISLQLPPSDRGWLDFLGINYYTRFKVNAQGAHLLSPQAVLSDLGWEIYPEGLLKMLRLADQWSGHLPLYITENGLADASDLQRGPFLLAHLRVLSQALAEGLPIKGYFHWSLLDNFEWADGFEPRFGLLNAERQWRPSARLYQGLIQAARQQR
ncbi:glycoside hydrolase family 1 protein [bacterium (Candidatus Blackallbacteria) CG17_big_fil_post_rev_8_21_14_2_50_48_46]|uniref:Glycoside hydrolase family 1 protein n=1 Tax=bacterium (Candidatus Blackallbacteria) CG17_big_fil_post_rev_8_21_14_2_50_48_46 TaxID=2014261 RepID=A0A2M7G2Q5_9BACT|nr:MAG: beta-glucosidase [bacterium (Candidatus Blackallbacteria) CG18_big_fil_WC_8_21_14_2_50_49_26]PIW15680.1 MAG: glycoside hydrolase family 1 protein [bacterium (Candidatus Blackallbacteria) CG17_big_fil_post_rev_8_21_14_2_50_48_46]PIW48685.1 MAG: glycoside hydrolase family 1 protein [bacterium (Candidatus Blackallbacteria) CG13_big_fil_rev_8_21_14_2_50_49_14]